MTTRDRLHQLVDELPDGVATIAAERILSHLRAMGEDPILRALVDAPLDDEPESDEERAAVTEGLEALARGDVVSDEELCREVGLLPER